MRADKSAMPMSDFMPMHAMFLEKAIMTLSTGVAYDELCIINVLANHIHLSNSDFLIHPENSPKPLSSHKRVKSKRQKGELFLVPL